jgi:hypothetical protein
MAKLFNDVRPGDLITANFMNQIIAELQSLEDRVSQLSTTGASSGPAISSVSPVPLHVGDDITILGQGFGPIASAVVTLGQNTITQFSSGSGDTVLLFTVPPIIVSDQGSPLFLSVSTPRGSATTSVTLYPAQPTIPNGTVLASLVKAPAALNGGQDAFFTFHVTATMNMDEQFTVTPAVDSGWAAVYVVSEATPTAVVPSQITIPKAASSTQPVGIDLVIKVSVPSQANATGNLKLLIVSQHNPTQLTIPSGPFPLKVGGTPPVVSNLIQPAIGFTQPNANYDGTNILVAANGQSSVPYSVVLVNPGKYTVSVKPPSATDDPNHLWAVTLLTSASLQTNLPNSTVSAIAVRVSAQANAPTSSYILRIESQADSTVATELPQPIKLKG